MPDISPEGAYDRGHIAGGIDARLDGHDRHFARINGSIEGMRQEMVALNLNIQRLADEASADRRTAVQLAAALKDADDARRLTTTDRYSPLVRIFALIAAIGTLISIYVAIR